MKHISFDESTVMGELARIANEKGLIKTAQQPAPPAVPAVPAASPLNKPVQLPPEAKKVQEQAQKQQRDKALMDQFKSMLDKTPLTPGQNAEDMAETPDDSKLMEELWKMPAQKPGADVVKPQGQDLFQQMDEEIKKQFQPSAKEGPVTPDTIKNSKDMNTAFNLAQKYLSNFIDDAAFNLSEQKGLTSDLMRAKLSELSKTELQKITKILTDMNVKARNPFFQKAVMNLNNNIMMMLNRRTTYSDTELQAKSSEQTELKTADQEKGDMSKMATESKVYDVTGETGKDLIDSAHPGNMHTELTHSKTKENLVETIVEQQEADIDVALSVPKGTYAMLMNLHDKLNKLGHKDILPELEKVIKLVAIPKDVLEYSLVTLANKLDAKGFIEVADKVDSLIKKARDDWQTMPIDQSSAQSAKTVPEIPLEPIPTDTKPQTMDFSGYKMPTFDIPIPEEKKKKTQQRFNIKDPVTQQKFIRNWNASPIGKIIKLTKDNVLQEYGKMMNYYKILSPKMTPAQKWKAFVSVTTAPIIPISEQKPPVSWRAEPTKPRDFSRDSIMYLIEKKIIGLPQFRDQAMQPSFQKTMREQVVPYAQMIADEAKAKNIQYTPEQLDNRITALVDVVFAGKTPSQNVAKPTMPDWPPQPAAVPVQKSKELWPTYEYRT